MVQNIVGRATLFLLLFIISNSVYAFRLEPMVASFTPEGEGATKIFRVENESKEKIAVKIQAYTRKIDSSGKETTAETGDFKIFPEQISLAPSDSRAIRVVYIGKKAIDQEQSYRLIASQLPVSFKENPKKSGINFLFQFVASVYVTSDKFYPKIEVESVKRIDPDHVSINIINRGQKHTLLKYVDIEFKNADGKTFKLNKDAVKNWDGENLLSGGRRTFKVKTPFNFDLKKNPPKIEVRDEI